MATHSFTFMGTAAGCGVPSFFCDCPACTEARDNPALARGDCGAMVRRRTPVEQTAPTLVIDTPPDARHQLLREDIRKVDCILLTHCHFDHVGGLGEYEYLVHLVRKQALPLVGSPATLAGALEEFHYMASCFDPHPLQPFDSFEFDSVRYTACPVTHAPGTYGYLIEPLETKGDEKPRRLFYASDTGPLPPETAERVRGADIMALDATFWMRNWSPEDHHSVQECIEEALLLDAGKLFLTHLCMHYDTPITYQQLIDYLAPYQGQVEVALDGMTIDL